MLNFVLISEMIPPNHGLLQVIVFILSNTNVVSAHVCLMLSRPDMALSHFLVQTNPPTPMGEVKNLSCYPPDWILFREAVNLTQVNLLCNPVNSQTGLSLFSSQWNLVWLNGEELRTCFWILMSKVKKQSCTAADLLWRYILLVHTSASYHLPPRYWPFLNRLSHSCPCSHWCHKYFSAFGYSIPSTRSLLKLRARAAIPM